MFPNNPAFVDRLVDAKQEEILREIRQNHVYDGYEQYDLPATPGRRSEIVVLVGLLAILGWLVSLLV